MPVQQRFGLGKAIALTVLGCGVAGAAFFFLLQSSLDDERAANLMRNPLAALSAARALDRDSEGRVTTLIAENRKLRSEVARQHRRRAVDGEAYQRLERHLKELQDEMMTLREEIAFYRGIVSYDQNEGLDIRSFDLDEEGDAFAFSLVLINGLKNDKLIDGTVTMSVVGEHQGQAKILSIAQLSDMSNEDIAFSFKHFQRIRGRLSFPAGFVPEKVYVFVSPRGDLDSVEKSFTWPISES